MDASSFTSIYLVSCAEDESLLLNSYFSHFEFFSNGMNRYQYSEQKDFMERYWISDLPYSSALHISTRSTMAVCRAPDLDGWKSSLCGDRCCNPQGLVTTQPPCFHVFVHMSHEQQPTYLCWCHSMCVWKCFNTRTICIKSTDGHRDQVSIFSCFLKSFMSWLNL